MANFKKFQWWYENMASLLTLDRSSLEKFEPERIENNWLKHSVNTFVSLILVSASLYVLYLNLMNIGILKQQ